MISPGLTTRLYPSLALGPSQLQNYSTYCSRGR
jgi:hypothetical protein